jgi:hypothetical protein
MKTGKRIYFICVLILSTHFVLAQNGMVSLGVKGGFNKPQLRGSDVSSSFTSPTSDMFTNFLVGLSATSQTGKYIWIKHDIFFAKRYITTQMTDVVNGNYASQFKRHYIDIYPISPTFHFKGFQLFAGPYLGILLDASVQRKNAQGQLYDASIYGNPTQNSGYAQKFDFGYVLGIEYEFNFGINVGFRYTRGFIPVIENAASQTQLNIFNDFTSLTLGYTFMGHEKSKEKKAMTTLH